MPTLTIAPADEACQDLVNLINTPVTGYVLAVNATYSRLEIDPLESIQALRVDVVCDTENTPGDRLDAMDQCSLAIVVWVRSPLPRAVTPDALNAAVGQLCLLRRQIFIQLNNYTSANGRIQVWDCDVEDNEQPLKKRLQDAGLFCAKIVLRVEVPR